MKVFRSLLFLWYILFPFFSRGSQFTHEYNPVASIAKIPFTYHDGFIIVDVTLARVFPLRFILDTGSEHSLLLKREYIDILRLPSSRKVTLLGADLKTEISARVYPKISIQVGDGLAQFQDVIVPDEYILPLEEMLGVRIDGILGASYFQNMSLDIDYRKKILTIANAGAIPKIPDKWESIPLRVYKNKPYIKAEVPEIFKDTIHKNLLLDTGASLSLVLQYIQNPEDTTTAGMVKSFWGKGLGGEMEGFGSETDVNLKEGHTFKDVFVCLQELDSLQWAFSEKDGLIGNLLLEQFGRICFDFSHQIFYYKPLKKQHSKKKMERSDVIVYAYGSGLRQYYVHAVAEQSVAWSSGLRPGDIILRIGSIPASWFKLTSLMKKMNHFTTGHIKIKVNQAGNIKNLIIQSGL